MDPSAARAWLSRAATGAWRRGVAVALGALLATPFMAIAASFTVPAGANYFDSHRFSTFAGAAGAPVTTGQLSPAYSFTVAQVGTAFGTGVVGAFPSGLLPAGSGFPATPPRMAEMGAVTGLAPSGRIRYTFNQALPAGTHVYLQDVDQDETATLRFYTCTGALINPSSFDYLVAATNYAPTATFSATSVVLADATGDVNRAESIVAVVIRDATVCRIEYTGTFGGGTFETYFSLPPTDLAITKSLATPNPVVVGGPVSWTVTLTNAAVATGVPGLSLPIPAIGVTISDAVNSGVTAVTATVSAAGGTTGGSCTVGAGNAVSCSGFSPLASGQSIVVTISGTLSASYVGTLLPNAATATLVAPNDRFPANNTGTSSTPVVRPLSLSKTWINAQAGDQVVLSVSGAAVGSATAGASTAPSTTTPATAQVGGSGSVVTLEEAFTGGLAANYDVTIDCTKTTDGSAVTVAVTASATTRTVVMPSDSGLACVFVNALRRTDLVVTKAASSDPVLSGDVVTFTLSVSNNGPLPVTGAVLQDSPGAGLDCLAPGPTATCAASGGASCPAATVSVSDLLGAGITLPTLTVGGQVIVMLECLVTASGL